MKKKVKVSIVSILKHTLPCAQYTSWFQKMRVGLSRKTKKILWKFSERALHYFQISNHHTRRRLIVELFLLHTKRGCANAHPHFVVV